MKEENINALCADLQAIRQTAEDLHSRIASVTKDDDRGLYFEPWQAKGDCKFWAKIDYGDVEILLEHPNGNECARYLSARECFDLAQWLIGAGVERLKGQPEDMS